MRRERVPRGGVRILRDRHNVPHIRGRTNDDVTWGAGWAARARPRAAARAGALQRPRRGARRAEHQRDRADRRAEDLPAERAGRARAPARRSGSSARYGRRGRQLIHDMRVYVKGINAYYRAKNRTAPAVDDPRRDRAQRDQERAVRRGRRRRGGCRRDARRPPGRARARQGLLGLERPASAPGSGDARLDPRQLPVRAAAGQPDGQRGASTTARTSPSQPPARRPRPPSTASSGARPATC